MKSVKMYLQKIEGQIESSGRSRGSALEKQLVELVAAFMVEEKPTTIVALCEATGKRPQHIHQVVKKSTLLEKTKIKGRTLIIPSSQTES